MNSSVMEYTLVINRGKVGGKGRGMGYGVDRGRCTCDTAPSSDDVGPRAVGQSALASAGDC